MLVHFQATLFFEITHEYYDWLKKLKKEKTRAILSEGTGRKTGNNLLSHGSEAALPSATEGLTNVFGMETCVSPRLWSPDIHPADRQMLMVQLLPRQSAITENLV